MHYLYRFRWLIGSLIILFGLTFPNWYVWYSTEPNIFAKQEINDPIKAPVAIVFGAAVYSSGPSPIFSDRLTVAANLYKSGMVQRILVSGDNSEEYYNEPKAGKEFLLKKGIKEGDIILDYAGFRSYDTCIRAYKIFGVEEALLVSQEFHLPRVVFLCSHSGIKSTGISADMRAYSNMYKNYFREYLATQLGFYQVLWGDYEPKFLGKEEPIDKE